MAAAPAMTRSQLRTFIECSLCLDILNDPRVLPCLHSFCFGCLQGTWASKQPKDTVNCPLCREEFVIPDEGISVLRKDHRVNNLIDVYGRNAENESHNSCAHKNEALDFYCSDCKLTVCPSCNIKDHHGHSIHKTSEFLDETRKHMLKELKELSKYEKDMNKRKRWFEKFHKRFLERVDFTERAINKKAEKTQHPVELQKMSLVEELGIIKQKQLKEIMKEREEMDSHSAEIESMKHFCKRPNLSVAEGPAEIFRAVTQFHSNRNRLENNHQVLMEQKLATVRFLFNPATPEEIRSEKNRIGSFTSVTTRLIKELYVSEICGVTKLRNCIYIIHGRSNFSISVYEDQNPFCHVTEICVDQIKLVADIASSEKFNCLYISDSVCNCIWRVTVDDHRVIKWLSDIDYPFNLSVTSDDHILNLREVNHRSQLEIYGPGSNLISIIAFSTDIQWPLHVYQKPSGEFMLIHKSETGNRGRWVISQLENDGKIISQHNFFFLSQHASHPLHLSLDLENDRLFLAFCSEDGVLLVDTTSENFHKLFLTEAGNKRDGYDICDPFCCLPMHYDAGKRQLLFNSRLGKGLLIFELS